MDQRWLLASICLLLPFAGCLGCEPTGASVVWQEDGAYQALGDETEQRTEPRIPAGLANRSLRFNATDFQEDWPGFQPTRVSFSTNGQDVLNIADVDGSEDLPDDGHQTLRVHIRPSDADESTRIEIEAWSYTNRTPWTRGEVHPVLVDTFEQVSRTDRDTIDAWIDDALDGANFTEEGFSTEVPAPRWIDVGVAIEQIWRNEALPHLVDHRVGELRITAVGWEAHFEAPTQSASTRVDGFQIEATADPTDKIMLDGDLGDREEIGEDRWAALFQQALDRFSVPSEAFPREEVQQETYCGFA